MDGEGSVLPLATRRPAREVGVPRGDGGGDALIRAALDSARRGVIVLDRELRTRFVTRAAAELLGLHHGTEAGGLPLLRLLSRSHVLDEAALQTFAAAIAGIAAAPREILLPIPAATGSRTLAVEMRPLGELGFRLSLEDITRKSGLEAWRQALASSDPVTGLLHRQHFLHLLRERLDEPEIAGVAVLRLALRRFKPANEMLGNAGGDALLRLVAGRLGGYLRGSDALARYGAVEFAMLVNAGADRAALRRLAERLSDLVSRPYLIEGRLVSVGASVGIACAPEDGEDADALMANAELALAAAEAEARGEPCFFEPRLDEAARRRRSLEAELGRALAGREFELHYQPQIDVQSRQVRVMEALIRWRSPTGLVPPDEFIPVAEQSGLIGPLGDWVLDQACHDAMAWPEAIAVAVNVSPLQFDSGNLTRSVARALDRSGLPGNRLEIEITENLLLRGQADVEAAFRALRAMGLAIVLDDFGTGYAALSQLARFRFDKIKIDRSFISAPDAATEHGAIVRAIAALGASLSVPTTAEGVETEAQWQQIVQDGCTQVQGFYFSHPVPADAIPELLQRLHAPAPA